MTIYVAEVSGRGIVAFDAADDVEANTRLTDRALLRDLHVLQHQGRPLWDGISKITLRGALQEEIEIWQARRATVAPEGDGGGWHVILIPVVDPSGFEPDDYGE